MFPLQAWYTEGAQWFLVIHILLVTTAVLSKVTTHPGTASATPRGLVQSALTWI
jgi:hypothetical protein